MGTVLATRRGVEPLRGVQKVSAPWPVDGAVRAMTTIGALNNQCVHLSGVPGPLSDWLLLGAQLAPLNVGHARLGNYYSRARRPVASLGCRELWRGFKTLLVCAVAHVQVLV